MHNEIDFYQWIINYKRLSIASAGKYSRAIFGVISDWAIENGFGHLGNIENLIDFRRIASEIKNFPIFIERNTIGNNMYSCALDRYDEYLDYLLHHE